MAGKARPLRLDTRSISCATLYAGQSFMEAQADVKEEDSRMGREDIEQDLRVPLLNNIEPLLRILPQISISEAAQRVLDDLKARARKLEAECKESGHGAGMAAPVEPASSRPVATPARADAPKKCIHRPVSSDAQPRSYTFWERAFPEEEETQLDPPEPADPAAATSPNAPKNPKSSGALAPVQASELSGPPEPKHSRAAEPEHSRAPEPKHSRAPEPKHSRAPEPEHSRAPEPEHSRAPEPKHSRAPEPEHSRAPEPEHSGASEPEHSGAPEPEHSRAPEPEHSRAPEPEHSRATESSDDELIMDVDCVSRQHTKPIPGTYILFIGSPSVMFLVSPKQCSR